MADYRDDERAVAMRDRVLAAFRGTVRPLPRQARRLLTEDGLAARLIDLKREVERITESEIVLPQSAIDAVDAAVEVRFPEEPYGPVAERFRATQLEIAKGAATLDGQIEGVPATREVFLNTHPEVRADLADENRYRAETQEQARDVFNLVKLTNPTLDETAAEAVVREARASGRDVRRALLEFAAEDSPEAHEALVDFHVLTSPTEHRYPGDGRQEHADATDEQIDAALDRAAAPKARPTYTQDELDAMTDEEVEAATNEAVSAGE